MMGPEFTKMNSAWHMLTWNSQSSRWHPQKWASIYNEGAHERSWDQHWPRPPWPPKARTQVPVSGLWAHLVWRLLEHQGMFQAWLIRGLIGVYGRTVIHCVGLPSSSEHIGHLYPPNTEWQLCPTPVTVTVWEGSATMVGWSRPRLRASLPFSSFSLCL